MQRVIENGGEGGFCAWEMEELLHLGDGGAQVAWRWRSVGRLGDREAQVSCEMEERAEVVREKEMEGWRARKGQRDEGLLGERGSERWGRDEGLRRDRGAGNGMHLSGRGKWKMARATQHWNVIFRAEVILKAPVNFYSSKTKIMKI